MIEDIHIDPAANQVSRNICLQVTKAEYKIRLEIQNLVDLGARKSGDFRLFLPGFWRAHSKSGDTDDPVLLAKKIQGLGRFLGHADYSFGVAAAIYQTWFPKLGRGFIVQCADDRSPNELD